MQDNGKYLNRGVKHVCTATIQFGELLLAEAFTTPELKMRHAYSYKGRVNCHLFFTILMAVEIPKVKKGSHLSG